MIEDMRDNELERITIHTLAFKNGAIDEVCNKLEKRNQTLSKIFN